jgi:hypothetical protein
MIQFSRCLAFLVICSVGHAQTIAVIPASEAAKHNAEEVYVEGVVASVHATPKGAAFINLDKAYPHQIFTGFIQNLSAVGDEAWLNGLKEKTIRIHGRINIYHAIPEIRILSKEQITVP